MLLTSRDTGYQVNPSTVIIIVIIIIIIYDVTKDRYKRSENRPPATDKWRISERLGVAETRAPTHVNARKRMRIRARSHRVQLERRRNTIAVLRYSSEVPGSVLPCKSTISGVSSFTTCEHNSTDPPQYYIYISIIHYMTMSAVHCTVCSVRCTVSTVQCTVYIIHRPQWR